MGLFNFWKKEKGEQPIDDKLLRAIRDSLIRGGFVNDIQDNADEYIKFGYQGNADVYSIIRRYVTMSTQAKIVLRQKDPSGKIVDINGHPLNEFLTMVNPNQSMEEFREAYAIYLLSIGNSLITIILIVLGVLSGMTGIILHAVINANRKS